MLDPNCDMCYLFNYNLSSEQDPEAAGRVLSEDEDDAMADALARARLNGGFVQDRRMLV